METQKIKEIENDIRDLINWVKVFEEEYNLEGEVVDQLRTKLEQIAKKVASLGSEN